MNRWDCIVVGAGFGGLGTALTLASSGARVLLLEALRYPGGCASTFVRGRRHFESGATLCAGLDETQLFGRWNDTFGLGLSTRVMDPVVELRTDAMTFAIPPDREKFLQRFCALPDAPVTALRAFFDEQRRVADRLWQLFDDPSLLPPFNVRSLLRHVGRSPRYLTLLPLLGRPLETVLSRRGLQRFTPLRQYLDAVCQITVQTDAATAEAPFALAAMDYYFRGARHIDGGIGTLAQSLCDAFVRLGGVLRFSDAVRAIEPDRNGWIVRSRRGEEHTRTVAANVLPQNLRTMLPASVKTPQRLETLSQRVDAGWGAAMLYLTIDRNAPIARTPMHLEMVADGASPFVEGNHIFCSLSGIDEARDPDGHRTATVSTHVPLATLRSLDATAQAAYIARVQQTMQRTLALRAPEVAQHIVASMTASPRTFERFTGRAHGAVGGIPRRAGLQHYTELGPRAVLPGLWLVGDTVFPGQSALATAIGGVRTATAITSLVGRREPVRALLTAGT